MSKIKDIINKIKSFENEDLCIIILSQEENHALLTYINNLEKGILEKEDLEMSKPSYVVYPAKIANQLVRKYQKENKELKDRLQQKDNIIKEAREYIKSNEFIGRIRLSSENKQAINKLLEILDKEDHNG